jgi:hypothetical protein
MQLVQLEAKFIHVAQFDVQAEQTDMDINVPVGHVAVQRLL